MQKVICFNIFFFLLLIQCVFPARLLPPTPQPELNTVSTTWHALSKFIDAGKGANFVGMSELKKYFHRFGYLNSSENFNDSFDNNLEIAVLNYQKNLGLPVTGILDSETITQIMSPRCGVPDHLNDKYNVKNYAFFEGEPRWIKPGETEPMTLTYAFLKSHMIDYISYYNIRSIFKRAFTRWAYTIPVNFMEIDDYYNADIKIGFYEGDHGDGWAFDGVLGVLAHAFEPEQGKLHLDKSETWAVDVGLSQSKVAIDLESVATHEIGHILGLAHSLLKESIMYPILVAKTRKVDLTIDDIEGIQKLYGSNQNFRYTPYMELDNSLAFRPGRGRWVNKVTSLVLLVGFFI